MSSILLPTQGLVNDFPRRANEIQLYDYDVVELIRTTLTLLGIATDYPHAFTRLTNPYDPQYLAKHVPEPQREAYLALLRWLYDELHLALVSTNLYDPNGVLCSDNFFILNGDVGIYLDDTYEPPYDS